MRKQKALLLLAATMALAITLPVAAQPERTGEQVVQYQCVLCHGPGVGGAPKIGDGKAWGKRANDGIDRLVRSALDGRNGMPPSGGMTGLSENELRAAIRYMLEKSGASKN
jgi:cytochrome c5